MKTRTLTKLLLLGLLPLLALSFVKKTNVSALDKPQQKRDTRPNILFIPIDDLRPEMGCYGNKIIKTPNMDRLAANGVVFNRAYTQQAVCSASRASLLTGMRPDYTQVWDLQHEDFREALPNVITLPQFFKDNGYYTVNFGKTFHNVYYDKKSWDEERHADGFPEDPDAVYVNKENLAIQKERELARVKATKQGQLKTDKFGFIYTKANSVERGEVDDDDAYYDGAQTTMAIEKLKELKNKGQAFFLSVGFYKPHLPFCSPKKYWDMYDRKDMPLAKDQFIPVGSPEFAVHGDAEMRSYPDRKDLPKPSGQPYDADKQRELLHAYYACVSYIDAQIGRLMKTLDELGLAENTIVVLWGDHGWKLGEHNSWAKMSNYEIDTRVPLIISGKGVTAKGQKSNSLTEFLDIYPTLCEMTGMKQPSNLQGNSLIPVLANPNATVKNAAYSQFLLGRFGPPEYRTHERMGYALRTDRYRYVEWYDWDKDNKKAGKYITAELFDHQTDPNESVNIANKPTNKKLVAELSKQLRADKKYTTLPK